MGETIVIMCPGCANKVRLAVGTVITDSSVVYCSDCNERGRAWVERVVAPCSECDEEHPLGLLNKDTLVCKPCFLALGGTRSDDE